MPGADPKARAERLAQLMVDRLQPHVPDGVRLFPQNNQVAFTADNGESGSVEFAFVFDWEHEDLDRQYEHAVWLVLEQVQDFIVELVLRDRWPTVGDRIPKAEPLPSSGVRRVPGGFEVFYTPGLVLPPLTDDELGM